MMIKKDLKYLLLLTLLCLTGLSLSAQKWPGGIHDPSSIVKCGDTYWVFGTGDGIYSMYSKDLISWQAGPTPFTKTGFPAWINNYVHGATDKDGKPIFHGGFWAPDIIYMNNKYYLYYSCSEWGTMTSTIGCVTNKTLNPNDPEYNWIDVGFLGIWSYQPGLALNAIDPSVMRGPDGKTWMVYGSFNEKGIVVTEIDTVSGKPKTYAGNLPGASIANSWTGPQSNNYGEGEGSSMIYHDGYYYLFYNKGGCCAGIASSYYVVMGRSTNPRGPFYDKEGKAMRMSNQHSGGTVVLKHDDSRGTDDRYFGPGHFGMHSENGVNYVTFHYYDPNGYYPNPAVNNKGGPTLGLAKLIWQEDGWPAISLDFVDEGVYTLENLFSHKVADLSAHIPAEGTALYQYAADSSFFTQKWLFTPLGSGEYTIRNYAGPDMFVEAGGTNNASTLTVTSDYLGKTNQRFRTVTSPNGKTIIYPSVKDAIWSLSVPTTSNIKLSLLANADKDHQKWNPIRFDEMLLASDTKLTLEHTVGTDNSIVVQSNGLWRTSVLYNSWLNVEASGLRNDTLNITYTENPDVSERKNRIYIISNGGESVLITVTQRGKPNAVGNLETRDQIVIHPNPACEQVLIEITNSGRLHIYNLSGQKLRELNLENGSNTLNIADLNGGIYLFRIFADGKAFDRKVIKY